MGEPFERTMGIVNGILEPMGRVLREAPIPPYQDYAHLGTAMVESEIEHQRDVAAAMVDGGRKVALFEFGMTPQLFHAFDCATLCLETFPSFFTRVDGKLAHEFLDAAEGAGVTSDTCSNDRFIIGAALLGELPSNSFFVTSSSPCDGTRVAYPILRKMLDCPMLFLDAPFRDDREALRYYAAQLKNELIPFVEEHTGRKFDIDRFREVIVESNKAYQAMVDIHDTYMVKPAPLPGMLKLAPFMSFFRGAGRPGATRTLEVFREDVTRRVREGRTEGPFEEKCRVMWVHMIPTYDRELFAWMEESFGATMVVNSVANVMMLEPVDPSSLDTMLEGVAWQGLDMTMSFMRLETQAFIDHNLRAYDRYDCDCMIATQHIGCQSVCGARGLLRAQCREREIPLLFLEFDYNDDRVLSTEAMREQIEEFFTTTMA
jgi:benzoyl-CoA reductase/2-hydroxyglutaryl-CoA dehydratase subunit BcrC/BadD/HgdB